MIIRSSNIERHIYAINRRDVSFRLVRSFATGFRTRENGKKYGTSNCRFGLKKPAKQFTIHVRTVIIIPFYRSTNIGVRIDDISATRKRVECAMRISQRLNLHNRKRLIAFRSLRKLQTIHRRST